MHKKRLASVKNKQKKKKKKKKKKKEQYACTQWGYTLIQDEDDGI